MKKKTQECLNNIRIRFPTYENECYVKRTRILRTMIATITTITTTNLTKGYRVTLYSDYLRATTLYAIYRNSPNLGCPKEQC